MPLQNELNTYVTRVDEVVTYLDGSHTRLASLDLGSAEVQIVINESGQAIVVITSSSGHAASIPAEVFAALV